MTINDTVNKLSEKENLILNLIDENSEITRKEISQQSSISVATVSKIIS